MENSNTNHATITLHTTASDDYIKTPPKRYYFNYLAYVSFWVKVLYISSYRKFNNYTDSQSQRLACRVRHDLGFPLINQPEIIKS